MQYKKEEVRNDILKAAKNEFIDKGYHNTSTRKIAKEAGVSVSNIYNYFDSKDEILKTVLKPLLSKIEWGKSYLNNFDFNTGEIKVNDLKGHQQLIMAAANFIDDNRELLELLLFKTAGSSLESYKQDILDWYANFWFDYIEATGEPIEVNEHVIRNIAGLWYNLIEEVVQYDIKGKELESLVNDMTIYIFGGWNKLVDWKKEI